MQKAETFKQNDKQVTSIKMDYIDGTLMFALHLIVNKKMHA